MSKFKAGDEVYIIESNRFVRQGTIVTCTGGIYLFKYPGGGIRVKENRLFTSKEEAQEEIDKCKPQPKRWLYFH